MTTAKLAGVAVVLMAGSALAASNVGFELEMGGDNHSAAWQAGPPYTPVANYLFTQGSTADGQTFGTGSVVTWGARVSAGGTQTAGAGAGSAIYGVANFVFDLELHQGSATGPLATAATFLSTINDGAGGDILAAASFAMVFNLSSLGPGRVVDPPSGTPPTPGLRGGPHCGGVDTSSDRLKSATYPTAAPGKLIGMGAGYNMWLRGGSNQTAYGIGMANVPHGPSGMGVKVLAEGQIDTTGLAAGTYVLKLIPGAGINVLRGDINLNVTQNAFATAADTTTGDTITFQLGCVPPGLALSPSPASGATIGDPNEPLAWLAGAGATSHDVYFGTTSPPPFVQNQVDTVYDPPTNLTNGTYFWRIDEVNACGTTTGTVWSFTVDLPPEALTAVAWRSIRNHTNVGPLPIVLDPSKVGSGNNGPVAETRLNGIKLIEVDFSGPAFVFGDITITASSGSPPVPISVEFTDPENPITLQIKFADDPNPGLTNEMCYTIDLTDAVFSDPEGEPLSGDPDCMVRGLVGDVNFNGQVTTTDQLAVKQKVNAPVDVTNARYDLNVSGTITTTDQLAVKQQVGKVACP